MMIDLILAQAAAQQTVVAPPAWERLPNGEDLHRAYPAEARRKRIAGRAMLICKVVTPGRLAECRTDFVEPAGFGFGPAALKLAPIFRMPLNLQGRSTPGGTVYIPVRFGLAKPTLPVQLAAICYAYSERLAAADPKAAGIERMQRYWRYRFPDALKEAGQTADPEPAMAAAREQEALRPLELREVDPRRRCEGLVPDPES